MIMDSYYSWDQSEHIGPAQKTWSKICFDVFVNKLIKQNSNSLRNCPYLPNDLPIYSSVSHIKESWPNPPLRIDDYRNNGEDNYKSNERKDSFSNQVLELIRRKRDYNKASTFGYDIQLQLGMISTVSMDIYPWNTKMKNYQKNMDGLHDEIVDFFQYIMPTHEEQIMRHEVVARLKRVVQDEWPEAVVDVFGSVKTELNLPTSDIDVVIFGKWDNPLWTLNDIIKRSGIASDCKVLDRATVPIVKMTDKETEVRIDISFNMENGLKSAHLIKSFIKEYPHLPQLVLLLKQYLLQRDLNEVWTGGISSYSLILMCVSFMKLRATKRLQNPDNLGETLILFLELYGRNFDYFNTGIRTDGDICHVPKEDLLKKMEGNHWSSILCIEDPLNSSNDIGRSSYGALHIKVAFDYAYATLSRVVLPQSAHLYEDSISILGRIIRITPEVLMYREFIRQKFSKKCTSEETRKDDEKSPIPNGIKISELSKENDFKKDLINTNNNSNQKMMMTKPCSNINEQGDVPCKNESVVNVIPQNNISQKKFKSVVHKKSSSVVNGNTNNSNSNANINNNHSNTNGKVSTGLLKNGVSIANNSSNGNLSSHSNNSTNNKSSPLKKNESEFNKHPKKTKVTANIGAN